LQGYGLAAQAQGGGAMTENTSFSALNTRIALLKNGKLPSTYMAAKQALAQCASVDECKGWADKADALKSYYKQAKDTDLANLATRIKARATQRMGELLKEFDARGDHLKSGEAPTSQREAARAAGLSKDQQVRAVRVANIPRAEFEAAVERDSPPSITELAEIGTKHQPRPRRSREEIGREGFLHATAIVEQACWSLMHIDIPRLPPEQQVEVIKVIKAARRNLSAVLSKLAEQSMPEARRETRIPFDGDQGHDR
jgi:hypothetical protein